MYGLSVLLIIAVVFAGHAQAAGDSDIAVLASDMSKHTADVVPSDENWSGLAVCHAPTGMVQWRVYLPDGGKRYIHWHMASGQSRPCSLAINGKRVAQEVLGNNTGGFHTPDLAWVTTGPFRLDKDDNTIRIRCKNSMPHLLGFVISSSPEPPRNSPLETLVRQRQEEVAETQRQRLHEINHVAGAKTRAKLVTLMPGVEQILFVRRYTLQSSHYYTDFIDGCVHFGGEISLLSLEDGAVTPIVPGPLSGDELAGGIFGRCDLSFDGKRVVFGYKRKIGEGFRIWEVNLDGTNLHPLTVPPDDEADRIAKYRLPFVDSYHHHTDDMHPCYLPDGGIAFASTRCEHGILCDSPDRLTTSVIYRMDGDGANIEKLSDNSVSESTPTVTNDGRILYTRWEYVDNGAVTNKGLWAMRPDGSGTLEVGGMSIAFPSVFNVGRAVPGSNNQFVCIGAPHMPLGVGTVMIVDTQLDSRSGDAVSYVTPALDVRHQWGWDRVRGGADKPIPPEEQAGRDGQGNTDSGPLYMDPFPISEDHFLVSHNPDKKWNHPNAYGLYLLGAAGDADPIYVDGEFSCWTPIPVRARPHVPVIPPYHKDGQLAREGLARVVVTDVYRGMDGVERGTVKYLRVNEHVPRHWAARRFWDKTGNPADCYDQQHSVISKDTHLGLKLQHGIVPVEEDGSAHFLVAADRNIFLQALDENYMEVQRERTFVNYRPGESRSCIGCHERSSELPQSTTAPPLALRRAADHPGPQPGEKTGARTLHYPADVQPVWDNHCIECHGDDKTEGKLDLTGAPTDLFSRSYEQLMARRMQPIIGENHPKAGNNHYLPPYSLGAHTSKLLPYLEESHEGVKLSEAERVRVITWLDSNGQFYGGYAGRKHIKYRNDPDFRTTPTFESETLLASTP